MGVVPIDPDIPDRPSVHYEENEILQSPVQKTMLFDKTPPVLESFTENRNQLVKLKR